MKSFNLDTRGFNNIWVLIFVAVIAIEALLLGMFIGQSYLTETEWSELTSVTKSKKVTPTPTATVMITDWEIYSNNDKGFSIRYPKDWILKEVTPTNPEDKTVVTLASPETIEKAEEAKRKDYPEYFETDIDIMYYDKLQDWTIDEENNTYASTLDELIKKDKPVSAQEITFAGQKAYKVIWSGFINNYTIMIEKNGHLYHIVFPYAEMESELTEIEKLILTTFQFID